MAGQGAALLPLVCAFDKSARCSVPCRDITEVVTHCQITEIHTLPQLQFWRQATLRIGRLMLPAAGCYIRSESRAEDACPHADAHLNCFVSTLQWGYWQAHWQWAYRLRHRDYTPEDREYLTYTVRFSTQWY